MKRRCLLAAVCRCASHVCLHPGAVPRLLVERHLRSVRHGECAALCTQAVSGTLVWPLRSTWTRSSHPRTNAPCSGLVAQVLLERLQVVPHLALLVAASALAQPKQKHLQLSL